MSRCLLTLTVLTMLMHALFGCSAAFAFAEQVAGSQNEPAAILCCGCHGGAGGEEFAPQGEPGHPCEQVCCAFIAVERASIDSPVIDLDLGITWFVPVDASSSISIVNETLAHGADLLFIRTSMPLCAQTQVWRL